MSPNPAVVIKLVAVALAGVGAVFGGIYRVFYGPRARARRRLQAGASQLEDRAIVTLTGTVRRLDKLLSAPLSGTACVAFQVRTSVSQRRGLLDQGAETTDGITVRELAPFELVTSQGVVVVVGPTFELVLPATPLIPRRLEREVEFLSAHGGDLAQLRMTNFEEVAVEPGSKLSVHGMIVVDIAPGPEERGFRDPSARIQLVAHDAHSLTLGAPR